MSFQNDDYQSEMTSSNKQTIDQTAGANNVEPGQKFAKHQLRRQWSVSEKTWQKTLSIVLTKAIIINGTMRSEKSIDL